MHGNDRHFKDYAKRWCTVNISQNDFVLEKNYENGYVIYWPRNDGRAINIDDNEVDKR